MEAYEHLQAGPGLAGLRGSRGLGPRGLADTRAWGRQADIFRWMLAHQRPRKMKAPSRDHPTELGVRPGGRRLPESLAANSEMPQT